MRWTLSPGGDTDSDSCDDDDDGGGGGGRPRYVDAALRAALAALETAVSRRHSARSRSPARPSTPMRTRSPAA